MFSLENLGSSADGRRAGVLCGAGILALPLPLTSPQAAVKGARLMARFTVKGAVSSPACNHRSAGRGAT